MNGNPQSLPPVQAVIFDMDGVLLDSEYAMRSAATAALAEWGVTARQEDFLPFTGGGDDRYVGGVAEKYGVAYEPAMKDRTYAIYLSACRDRIRCFEQIPETMIALSNMGMKLAIASSADAIKANANIEIARIPARLLGAVITGSDVAHKKPDPTIFLLAAERLGIEPQACVVAEDAPNGIHAACNAGMRAIGVTSSFSEQTLREAGATLTVAKTCLIPAVIGSLGSHHNI